MKSKIILIIICLLLLLAVLFSGVVSCNKDSGETQAQAAGLNMKTIERPIDGSDVDGEETSDTSVSDNTASQNAKLPLLVIVYIILSIVFSGIFSIILFFSLKSIDESLEENKSAIRKLADANERQFDTNKNDSGEKVRFSDNKELKEIKEMLHELADMIKKLSSNVTNIRIDTPDMNLPNLEGMMIKQKDEILSAIKNLEINENIELHSEQTTDKLSEITNISEELQDNIKKLFNILEPEKDIRFMNLRIHFEDKYELVRDRFYRMEKETEDLDSAMVSFIEDYSLILSLHEISSGRENLENAYLALKDVLNDYDIELITPMPGDEYHESIMAQNKTFGESNKVYRVVYPGFKHENYQFKAKVDVK